MRILITNDDGINAPGLAVLEEIARGLAGPEGEVITVAPAFEQSGVGHAVSYNRPMSFAELGPNRFAAEGSPADCVLAGLYEVMPDARPDLVLSGVNRGNNSAENALYSGTLGGAMEAALQGIPAIAMSQFLGPACLGPGLDPFEAARVHGPELVRKIWKNGIWDDGPYRVFYNVNFPPVPAAQVKGHRVAAQGYRTDSFFSVVPANSPNGRRFLWIKGGPQHGATAPGTDAMVNLEGYTSVTPMRADLTAHDLLTDLTGRLA
ncbi:5'-nucleotidase /3'-nucleotidase /exopolyphosphatase [Rhodobacter aestuarii]|uniref:5'-nucleotidase SurE n=1 Tax=Rhodobacter aestuarii TaxID=453582 RepID=A0A1N7NNJ0_9RHOB|nr:MULTISPECIES: 5'/3'-nucleotidase SurE [Rhodobacter]PTV94660.1 5'-nucleotidase /3'-nucleotidase /exopolyphosphatase [Rhodobacter aestuarii]SIS99861.1 5'-nucleotidase /3'-nucleotidase /exopolyphosphatase [Rhodobacter aestuarii]SOC13074.1 5'-nucleotidase /3'-nucleotidase /exopolyphosphatase [Rhodobacter sp. JA431]